MEQRLSFAQLFGLLVGASAILLTSDLLFAWSGPASAAPNGNVAAPINVGSTDQVKNAGISLNSLAVFGSQYIQEKLGINKTNPLVALHVAGSMILGNGGELCQAVTEGGVRYNATSKKLEFCNGTSWSEVGGSSGSPLTVAAYANFSDSTGSVVVNDSYNLSVNMIGYGSYRADFTSPQSNLNYLVFFSPSYDGGAAFTMWERGSRSTSSFYFYCTHGESGNRYCGDHVSILVMKASN